MNKNIGTVTRVMHVAIGIGALGAGYFYRSWWGAVGLLFIITGSAGFCPLCAFFGSSCCRTEYCQK